MLKRFVSHGLLVELPTQTQSATGLAFVLLDSPLGLLRPGSFFVDPFNCRKNEQFRMHKNIFPHNSRQIRLPVLYKYLFIYFFFFYGNRFMQQQRSQEDSYIHKNNYAHRIQITRLYLVNNIMHCIT